MFLQNPLSELPLKEIKHRLSDVTFKRIKKKRRSIQFDVKKGEQHLRVQFLDYRGIRTIDYFTKNMR